MQHPFAGLLRSDQTSDQAVTGSTVKEGDAISSRRGLLGMIAGLVSLGAFGYLSRSKAHAAESTTFATGEEGGRGATTYSVGEEGGHSVTTYAIGEEGGRHVTTQAIGEEGGRPPVRVRG
jgi:hypothetical protein